MSLTAQSKNLPRNIKSPNLCEWWAKRRCQSARFRRCCSWAPGLLLGWSTSPQPPAVPPPVSVTEARWQKWSARKPIGSSDLASTIFRMAPRSSSPTPACERNSLSVSDFAARLSGIPGGVAPDRRFSLSAIAGDVTRVTATEAEVKGRIRLVLNFAAALFYLFYRTLTPVKVRMIRHHWTIFMWRYMSALQCNRTI